MHHTYSDSQRKADITSAFNKQIAMQQSFNGTGNIPAATSPTSLTGHASLTNSITSSCTGTTSSISLHQAWKVMFTDLERSDYLFEDFMEDYMYSDNTDPIQQRGSKVQDWQPQIRMTLGEIFTFLEANQ